MTDVKIREKTTWMNNLDPTIKTNTVDPQGFALVVASPVYGPNAYLGGSFEMNCGVSEARRA